MAIGFACSGFHMGGGESNEAMKFINSLVAGERLPNDAPDPGEH
jgi:hypothetical protein